MNRRTRCAIRGIVQGVGFRPFIYQLAHRYRLTGYVINSPQGVELEVEGPEKDIAHFFDAVFSEQPPLAHIAEVEREEVSPLNDKAFRIEKTQAGQERSTLISPDVSICTECLAELTNPADRRFRYPFINCTNCGPRYTIIQNIPYDRAATTMAVFTMCPACRAEYEDPLDRRFHAQPNACWDCGPGIALHDRHGRQIVCDDPIRETISLLEQGCILAIKGLGGFHLAVHAADHRAVVRLRKRKHREEKPLALMVKDLETARQIAYIDDFEAGILKSHQRPILLLRKRRFHGLSSQVAPKNKCIGIMLPYTPLHHLLMEGPFKALVMTSGNMTEEPINIDNQGAFDNLAGIADFFLVHDRDIHLRSDDSVLRVVDGNPREIRRSRGYVPVPVFLPREMKNLAATLAVGGELKNTICLTKENRAFISQHIGDMENLETLEFFKLTIHHLKRILEIHPAVLAHDLHPDYLSTKYAREQDELPALAVQHHHAHIVSCLAEHGLSGPVIGIALDGTGFGTDAAIWGGEILFADLTSFRRAGHLAYVPLPGGDAAAKSPWRMALAYLDQAYGKDLHKLPLPFVRNLDQQKAGLILKMGREGINAPLTSSCGRLFDAVSALLGIRRRIAFEGQAAIELEMSQNRNEKGRYAWDIEKDGDLWVMQTSGIIKGIVADLIEGLGRGVISRRFHNTLIGLLTDACLRVRDESGINEIALSGGTLQNVTILTGLTRSLRRKDFTVYSQAEIPSNDGGLSLGQAVCAGLRYAGWKGRFE